MAGGNAPLKVQASRANGGQEFRKANADSVQTKMVKNDKGEDAPRAPAGQGRVSRSGWASTATT
jgi:hypothetical protein